MLKDELKLIDKSDEAVKKTGLTVGVVLISDCSYYCGILVNHHLFTFQL